MDLKTNIQQNSHHRILKIEIFSLYEREIVDEVQMDPEINLQQNSVRKSHKSKILSLYGREIDY